MIQNRVLNFITIKYNIMKSFAIAAAAFASAASAQNLFEQILGDEAT